MLSVVPPTATTLGEYAGYPEGGPLSPVAARNVIPWCPAGVVKIGSKAVSPEKLRRSPAMETTETFVFCSGSRLPPSAGRTQRIGIGLVQNDVGVRGNACEPTPRPARFRRPIRPCPRWHWWEASCRRSGSAPSASGRPSSLNCGRPNSELNALASVMMVGSLYASTMAIVMPAPLSGQEIDAVGSPHLSRVDGSDDGRRRLRRRDIADDSVIGRTRRRREWPKPARAKWRHWQVESTAASR